MEMVKSAAALIEKAAPTGHDEECDWSDNILRLVYIAKITFMQMPECRFSQHGYSHYPSVVLIIGFSLVGIQGKTQGAGTVTWLKKGE